jgi:hypothetical protein
MELHKLASPKKKALWNKDAIAEWQPNIDALATWKYISDDLAKEMSAVYKVRCLYLHSGDISNVRVDSLRAIKAAYSLLNELIGFPAWLFKIGNIIQCLNPNDPLVKVFYEQD